MAVHRAFCTLYLASAVAVRFVADAAPGTRGAWYLAGHAALTAWMLGAWMTHRTARDHRWTVMTGILARVALIGVEPFTTHDVQRYLWDGATLLAGVDPYTVAPIALDPNDIGWALPPDNTTYPTIYPPGALALFAVAAGLGAPLGPLAWSLVVALASTLLVLAGERLLRAHGAERHVAWVALSPLLLLEGSVGQHVDLVAAFLLVAGLVLADRRRWLASGVVLGLGGLVKVFPLGAAVVLSWTAFRRGGVRVGAAALATVAAGYALAVLGGLTPIGSLPVFFAEWRFGSPLFALYEHVAPTLGGSAAVLVVFAGATLAWRPWRGDAVLGTRMLLGVALLIGPVVFPWYLTPLVVLAAVDASFFYAAWLALAPLTYEVIDRFDVGLGWEPAAWPLFVVGLGWALGTAVDAFARRKRAPRTLTEGRARSVDKSRCDRGDRDLRLVALSRHAEAELGIAGGESAEPCHRVIERLP